MKTEKDIRQFFRNNTPPPAEGDGFMAEFRRKTETLPQPAYFERPKTTEEIKAAVETALRSAKVLKRHLFAKAALAVAVLVLVAIGVHFLLQTPEVSALLSAAWTEPTATGIWKYLIVLFPFALALAAFFLARRLAR